MSQDLSPLSLHVCRRLEVVPHSAVLPVACRCPAVAHMFKKVNEQSRAQYSIHPQQPHIPSKAWIRNGPPSTSRAKRRCGPCQLFRSPRLCAYAEASNEKASGLRGMLLLSTEGSAGSRLHEITRMKAFKIWVPPTYTKFGRAHLGRELQGKPKRCRARAYATSHVPLVPSRALSTVFPLPDRRKHNLKPAFCNAKRVTV